MKKNPDELANLWNKTKDPKYKKQWYQTIREIAHTHGYYNSKRRTLPFDPNNEQDVRGIGTSKKR